MVVLDSKYFSTMCEAAVCFMGRTYYCVVHFFPPSGVPEKPQMPSRVSRV